MDGNVQIEDLLIECHHFHDCEIESLLLSKKGLVVNIAIDIRNLASFRRNGIGFGETANITLSNISESRIVDFNNQNSVEDIFIECSKGGYIFSIEPSNGLACYINCRKIEIKFPDSGTLFVFSPQG